MRETASRRLAIVTAAAAFVFGGMVLVASAEEPPEPRRHRVTIEANVYAPATLTVNAGEIVEWVNKDYYPHTVTAIDDRFDSGAIAAGESWTYTAESGGEFAYRCTYHPPMKGTLRVR